jgi:Ca2+-binding EF-hand superfamily protein
MKATSSFILAALLMGAATFAHADFTPEDLNRNVTFYDVNKDGKIMRTEWMAMAKERLEKMAKADAAGKMMVDSKKANAFLLQLQADSLTSGPMVAMSDVLQKLDRAFEKADPKNTGMNSKQFENFLRELMKSNG